MMNTVKKISYLLLFNFFLFALSSLFPMHIHGHTQECCSDTIFFSFNHETESDDHCRKHCDGKSILEYINDHSTVTAAVHTAKPDVLYAVPAETVSFFDFHTAEYQVPQDYIIPPPDIDVSTPRRAPPVTPV